mmetsp:Transcript_12978/g.15839  ORF Transcript_12978/g.15839 Transcript_12978/m.15839 type:complete len:99 (-) Transcript_12978:470-766(-)
MKEIIDNGGHILVARRATILKEECESDSSTFDDDEELEFRCPRFHKDRYWRQNENDDSLQNELLVSQYWPVRLRLNKWKGIIDMNTVCTLLSTAAILS